MKLIFSLMIASLAGFSATDGIMASTIECWNVSRKDLPVSLEVISSEVKTDKEFTLVTFFIKGEKHKLRENEQKSPTEVFDSSKKRAHETDSFFGPGEYYLVAEKNSDKKYIVFFENSGNRFRIAEVTRVGANGWYVQCSFAHTSDEQGLISMMKSMRDK